MKEQYIKQADFNDWLTLPLIKTFIEILEQQAKDIFELANQITYRNYIKKELDINAVKAYAKLDGMQTVLSLIEQCQNDVAEERDIEGEKVIIYPIINELIENLK